MTPTIQGIVRAVLRRYQSSLPRRRGSCGRSGRGRYRRYRSFLRSATEAIVDIGEGDAGNGNRDQKRDEEEKSTEQISECGHNTKARQCPTDPLCYVPTCLERIDGREALIDDVVAVKLETDCPHDSRDNE